MKNTDSLCGFFIVPSVLLWWLSVHFKVTKKQNLNVYTVISCKIIYIYHCVHGRAMK